MTDLTTAGLFDGIGGFPLAAERVGMTVMWHAEVDKSCGRPECDEAVKGGRHASRVLAHHWPSIPNLGDVHDVRQPPTVDVLTGGFPCQDYSVAGQRGGLAGDRGALWWEFHRLIAESRPRWVVGENVPGLLSSRGGRDFATIIDSLVELGYGVVWRVLDAQWFGLAQRRRRVFIVGHSGGIPRPSVLAIGQGVSGDPRPSRTSGQDIAGTIAPGSQRGGQRSTDLDGHGAWIVSPPLTAKMAKGTGGPAGDEAQNLIATETVSSLLSVRRGVPSADEVDQIVVIEPEPGQGADLKAREVDVSPALDTNYGKGTERGVAIVYNPTRIWRPDERVNDEVYAERPVTDALHGPTGNKEPLVVEPVAFAQNQRDEIRDLGDQASTLNAEKGSNNQTYVVQDTRPLDKDQNGLGISEDDVAYTLDQTGAQGVADVAGVDAWNQTEYPDQHHTLRTAKGDGDPTVRVGASVRRLTPLECERLQGFPDGWTDIPGNADTQRYRQLGNAVAVPVAEWILRRIVEAES